uniref:RING-type domain-containing protein n=1 Tax=Macrostomum lignano TaxID=282301 RepID=A0A1I8JGZ3_9PLAT
MELKVDDLQVDCSDRGKEEEILLVGSRICKLAASGDLIGLKSATDELGIGSAAGPALSVDDLFDSNGFNPLMRSAAIDRRSPSIQGQVECARHLLVTCGADPDASGAKQASGFRALHLAAETGNEEVARLLLAAGADRDAQTVDDCWTPLMLAVIGDQLGVARLLLQCQADAALRDSSGRTAEDWAVRLGRCEVLNVLRRDLCEVCRTDDVAVTFRPCGHRTTCRRCCVLLTVCLSCNRPIEIKEGQLEAASADDEASSTSTEPVPIDQQQLDERFQCRVCMSSSVGVAFGCGHQACRGCAKQLTACHMCRRFVDTRIRLYN